MLESACRRVVQHEHFAGLLRTRHSSLSMDFKQVIELDGIILQQSIRSLKRCVLSQRIRQAQIGVPRQSCHHFHVYAVGAYGFFALPYTIIVYPFVFAVMPLLWKDAKAHNHVTAADVVRGRYHSRQLELAVALTGVLATTPYIALQLIGMETIIHAVGLEGKIPLAAALPHPRGL